MAFDAFFGDFFTGKNQVGTVAYDKKWMHVYHR